MKQSNEASFSLHCMRREEPGNEAKTGTDHNSVCMYILAQ